MRGRVCLSNPFMGEANIAKSRRFLGKEAAALLWRTRAQHIYYTTFIMCYSILIMHKYCI